MAKTIRKTIQITTRKRNPGVKINEEFYSYDKNNAQFEFIMDYDVPADKVIALFHFEQTNRYYETVCQFKGNLITIEFDTSLIVEDELVTGYLYFDKLEKSTDVYRFTFGARLSEIDKTRKLPVEEKVSRRIVPVADIVTKQELEELMDKIKKNGGTYDDAEIRNSISSISERVQTLENKPDNDTRYDDSDVKSRLSALESNATKYLTEHQPLTSIEERIQQVEARFNNLSNIYLSSHQSLEHLVTKKELEDKHYLSSVPEEYAKKTDLYNDSELRNKITQLETNSVTKEKVESVENRVQTLENKSVVTHEELESAGYVKTTDLTNFAANSKVEAVESRVLALENKPAVVPQGYDDSALSGRVSALEAKQDKDTVYNDEEIKRRLTTLEGKTDNFITGVSVNKEGSNVTLTYNYVDGQTKNVSFTDSDTVNVAYDDSGLKQRITNLENRPQVDLTDYAKKSEIPQAYNDSELSRRVSVLETKEDKDTIYNDEEIKRRLTTLEAKPAVDVSEYAKKTEVPTIDSVNNLLRTQGEQATKISALESKTAYEIHGTGMPNGKVTAPIGTTYVDMSVTNGALKWIKKSGDGNTGWEILIGDTGWRTLNSISKLGNSFVKVRRVNNQITYQLGGLEWGWFGIVRRGGAVYSSQPTDRERNCYILNHNQIPEGFRTPNSLIGAIYNDRGVPYGTWYIGNPADANHLRFQFSNPVPTDSDIGDIRVSTISYYTDDEWPTTLP